MSTDRTVNELAQATFDKTYISSKEIIDRLGISKSTLLLGNKKGFLPTPVTVHGIKAYIWVRDDAEAGIVRWEQALNARKALNNSGDAA